jgi:molybdate/tungstate transport system substrate-binding protein
MKTISKMFMFCLVAVMCAMTPGSLFSQAKKLSGDLIIFHAGSLSVPMKEAASAFMKLNPDVKILLESAGSVASARKITDLNRPCDIMASADYAVIDIMLIPKFADYNIRFVSNEMSIVYNEKSRHAAEINQKNWYEILLQQDVAFARADPNSDPCGYRALMTMQLAEKYYKEKGLVKALSGKDLQYMRPKEVDLLALLESGSIDYIFLYKSVAMQHNLKYLVLPDQINLKDPKFAADYSTASVEINGKAPGEKETIKGEPMIYGITILRDAPNKDAAIAFLNFLLSKDQGMKIMEKNGQPSVIPMSTKNYDLVPDQLKQFVTK